MKETAEQANERELAEAKALLIEANRLMSRVFNMGEGEGECVDCGRTLSECENDKADCGQINE